MKLVLVGLRRNLNNVMENSNLICVVAGIFIHPTTGNILIAKRHLHRAEGGKWEFPGGKIKMNENQWQALVRECREELGCEVLSAYFYTYSEQVDLHLSFWKIVAYQGEPFGREQQEILWVPPRSLSDYVFPSANQQVVAQLANGL